jgi:hypothetical protein
VKALSESEFNWLQTDTTFTDESLVRLSKGLVAKGLLREQERGHITIFEPTEAGQRAVRVHKAARAAGVL